jgi:Family of unknown function (DUF6278)
VQFHPSHGEWIKLLGAAGFVVDALHELYAAAGAASHSYYALAAAQWAAQWPVIGELEGGQWESVAGALLYPSRPASVVSLAHIEAAAAKQAIMLTWYDEVPWRRKPTQHEGAKASRPCHQQHELAVGCTGFGESAQNGIVAQQWRRWLPGPKHGLARGVMIYGAPRPPGPEQLRDSLGQCESLRAWARLQGLELDPVPEDLTLLDEAIDRAIAEYGPHAPMSPEGNDAGLFLGTVIVSAIHGAHWRLWPNGHPVVRLASGRDLDVVALGHDRVHTGQPRLADVYTDAAATDPGSQT